MSPSDVVTAVSIVGLTLDFSALVKETNEESQE